MGKSLFIPFAVALAIGYIIISLVDSIQKFSFWGRHFPKPIAYVFALTFLGILFWIFLNMLIVNVATLIQSAPIYQKKFYELTQSIFEMLHIKEPPDLARYFEGFDIVSWGSSILFMLTDFAGSAGLILVYVIFILAEHVHFNTKVDALFLEQKNRNTTRRLVDKVFSQIQAYVRIKTSISIMTSFLSYLILTLVGVDFAVFWAFLIFVLNFIPTIGSIVATIFPSVLTLLQFGSLLPFLFVTISLVLIQFFVGNFLEPRVMGRSFNLSGLVILLSLALWGAIWGIIGMFLCVPIMVIANIILANFPETRPIAVLLSEKGEIEF